MRNFLRKATATAALVIASAGAVELGVSFREWVDSAESSVSHTVAPSVSWDGAFQAPDGYRALDNPACEATLSEVRSQVGLPGARWMWADLDRFNAWGQYLTEHNMIVLDIGLPCEYVGQVATHEIMHHIQDLHGLWDDSELQGPGGQPVTKFEMAAECAARVVSAAMEWPVQASYPELGNVSCEAVSAEVRVLLSFS